MLHLRPHNRFEDVDGLYLVGGGTHPGSGLPVIITENGIATDDDAQRVWYMRNHIAAIGKAIRHGYDVRGYFAWSLADNYEWHYGYTAKFGLATMDPQTYDRVFKPSAKRYTELIRKNPTVRNVSNLQPKHHLHYDGRRYATSKKGTAETW